MKKQQFYGHIILFADVSDPKRSQPHAATRTPEAHFPVVSTVKPVSSGRANWNVALWSR
jgi:hypothetical protein